MTMHTQTPAPATLGHAQAIERSSYLQRRDVALAALAARAGADMPTIQDGGRPKPAPSYVIGEALVQALLAEAACQLADEIDVLRTEIDGLKAALAGAGNGVTR